MSQQITKVLIGFLGCFLVASQLLAQEMMRFTGQIVDADTGEPLAFSTINLDGTTTGAVSNFEGYFDFTCTPQSVGDTIKVSMLGYKPLSLSVSELKDRANLTIEMEEHVIQLAEVVVNERQLTAIEIVNKVIDNIPNNYPDAPYLIEGFTRSHKHECGQYVTLYEAVFELNGRGYHKKSPEKIFIREARQSQHQPYYHSRVLRNNRNLYNSMAHINDVLYRSYSLKTAHHRYAIDKYVIEEESLVYVIKTTQSEYVKHTLYVNADDFALLKVVMEMDTPEGEDWNPHLNKGASSDSLSFKVTRISKTIQFEKQKDRYFSKYMDWLVEGKLYYTTTQETFCNWGFRFENMFGTAQYPFQEKLSYEGLMNPRSKKDPASTAYKPGFWETHPLLKEFPIPPQIVKDLEVNGSLESQFKQTSE